METKLIDGIPKTRDEVVIENMKLVYKISRRFVPMAKELLLEEEDLHQVGAIGLMIAFDKYNPKSTAKFSTYAYYQVFGAIGNWIRTCDRGPHVPSKIKNISYKIRRNHLEDKSVREIAQTINEPDKCIERALRLLNTSIFTLDTYVNEDDGKGPMRMDLLRHDDDYSNVIVVDFINRLSDTEKNIAYGIFTGESRPQIAKRMGCSHQNITYHISKIKAKYTKYYGEEATVSMLKEDGQYGQVHYSRAAHS